jgi:predicted ATPase
LVKKLNKLLMMVRDNQYNCYLLASPAGTGKSTLMTAMYHRALGNSALESFERDVYISRIQRKAGILT